jgi:hypothetical protein
MQKLFPLVLFLSLTGFGQQASNPGGGNLPIVTATPATCTPNVSPAVLMVSANGTSGALYYCSAVNTWTATGGSGTFNALTNDATSTASGGATVVVGLNSTSLAGLASGLLFNTTSTGVPSTRAVTGSGGICALNGVCTWTAANVFSSTINKITFTAPATAWTIQPTGDSQSTTIPGGTLVNNAVATLSSLTSIGTIGTGTWQGSLIGGTYGGTGVNNGANTLTLSGNLATTGAFNPTFAIPSSSTWTFFSGGGSIAPLASPTFTGTVTVPSVTGGVGTINFSGSTHTLPAVSGLTASKPATCTTGEEYFATDAIAGQNMYYCTATNAWTQQSAAGSLTIAGTSVALGGSTVSFPSPGAIGGTTPAAGTFTTLSATSASIGSGITCTAGTGGVDCYSEGTVPSVGKASGVDVIYADSTQHGLLSSFNNGSYLPLVQGPASSTNSDVALFSGTGGGLLKDGGAFTLTGMGSTFSLPLSLSSNTVTCPTCIVATVNPGVGILHVAGATQTATSSPINLGAGSNEISGNLPVTNLNSGTAASSSTFWRGDGTWVTPAGGGNISTSGSITTGSLAEWASGTTLETGNLSGDCTTSGAMAITCTKTSSVAFGSLATLSTATIATGGTNATSAAAGTIPNASSGTASSWTPTPTLGAAGTLGSVTMGNATSGLLTLEPVTGALGTVTVSIPAATDTLVNLAGTQTLTNKTLTAMAGSLASGVTATTQATGDTSTDVATDAFVAAAISAVVDMKDPVQAATTTALIFSPTYSNGTAGVGATLTATTVGVLLLDGYTPVLGDRLLIKNQASTFQNGCYTVTTLGVVVTTDYILTRCTDFNQASNIANGDTFPVLQGTTNVNQQFTENGAGPFTLGTTAITFAQTSGGSQLTASLPIVITGNALSAPTAVTSAASLTAGGIMYGAGLQASAAATPCTAKQIVLSGGSSAPTCIDFPERFMVPAANCNNTTAGAGWSIGSGGTVTCRAGTNNLGGFVAITDTSSSFAQFMVSIPGDWDTATMPYIGVAFQSATDTTSGHTVIPEVAISCSTAVNGTVTDDHTLSAYQSLTTTTFGASAVAHGIYTTSVQLNSTSMSGCIAGSPMVVSIGRATDTATGVIGFYYANVTFPRLLVVGAQ